MDALSQVNAPKPASKDKKPNRFAQMALGDIKWDGEGHKGFLVCTHAEGEKSRGHKITKHNINALEKMVTKLLTDFPWVEKDEDGNVVKEHKHYTKAHVLKAYPALGEIAKMLK